MHLQNNIKQLVDGERQYMEQQQRLIEEGMLQPVVAPDPKTVVDYLDQI